MKIDRGRTPIWISRRHVGGAEVIQGTSRVRLSNEEVRDLIHALTEIMTTNDAHGQEKMTKIGNV